MKIALSMTLVMFLCVSANTLAQNNTSAFSKITNFPSKLFSRLNSKTADLNKQLTNQTVRYLYKLAKREPRLKKKLFQYDSVAAKKLYPSSLEAQYATIIQKMKTDTFRNTHYMGAEYQPNLDSLQPPLAFLNKNPQAIDIPNINSLSGTQVLSASPAESSLVQLQHLQAKMQNADFITFTQMKYYA